MSRLSGYPALFFCAAVLSTAHLHAQSAGPSGKAAAVKQVLEIGLQPGMENFRKAESLWRVNRLAAARDARFDYAWGLVLRKHAKTREAERQFLVAGTRAKNRYLPARQAAAWLRIVGGKTSAGLALVDTLIRQIAKSNADNAVSAAGWIGRVVAALEKTKLAKRDVGRLKSTAKLAEQQLTGKLRAAYDAGRKDVEQKSKELSVQKLKTELAAKDRIAKAATKKQAALKSKKKTIGQQQKSLKLSAGEWKTWLEKQTETAKTQFERLEKEYKALDQRRQSISRSYFLAQRERNVLTLRMQAARSQSRGRTVASQGQNQTLLRLENDMIGYNNRYIATTNQMTGLQRSAAQVLAGYRGNVKKYETATGQIGRKNAALAKWESQVKRQERDLRNSKKNSPIAAKLLARRMMRFSTYAPFDLGAEKNRLLARLGYVTQK